MTAGMQVAAEIKLADQTVMEYLLSPSEKPSTNWPENANEDKNNALNPDIALYSLE